MKIKTFATLTFFLFFIQISFSTITGCACGSHSEGVYTWEVEGGDCCKDSVVENSGFYTEYEQQHNGVWTSTSNTAISDDVATDCCRPA